MAHFIHLKYIFNLKICLVEIGIIYVFAQQSCKVYAIIFFQILEFPEQFSSIVIEFNSFYCWFASPSFSLYCNFLVARHAAVWRTF